jgi:hypothetical protein
MRAARYSPTARTASTDVGVTLNDLGLRDGLRDGLLGVKPEKRAFGEFTTSPKRAQSSTTRHDIDRSLEVVYG